MRFTNTLFAQHLGWTIKKHWQVQGKRTPRDTGAAAELLKHGIQVKTPAEIFEPKRERVKFDVVGVLPKEIPEDENHPNWHNTACYSYIDRNVLLEGLKQAQVLTNTLEISGFPKQVDEDIKKLQLTSAIDRNIQNAIMSSHVFDAEQVKLPKVKLEDRPAFNLPREYGISYDRRNRLLTNKLIFECEKLSGHSVSIRRRLFDNAPFKSTFTKDGSLVKSEVTANKLITTTHPLNAIKGKFEGDLPDLYPLKSTISIPKKNIYTEETFYPLNTKMPCGHPHTIFSYFNKERVGNLHQLSVSTTQFESRTMLSAFTTALARAKQLYGDNISGTLPKPIVVQSIQSDSRVFHFGIYQLNTLDLSADNPLKNYWFHEPSMDLFTACGYNTGRPFLDGYNKDVIRILNVFYNNS